MDNAKIPKPLARKGVFLGYSTCMGKGSHSKNCKRVYLASETGNDSMRDSEHVSVDQTNLDPLSKSALDQIHGMLKNCTPVAPVDVVPPLIVPSPPAQPTAPPIPTGVAGGADQEVCPGSDLLQSDGRAVIGAKTPKAQYIKDRVTLAAGHTPAQIVHLQYVDSKGYTKAYLLSDLKYDIKCKYLKVVTTPGQTSGAALYALAQSDHSGVLSAAEIMTIKMYRSIYGSEAEIHVDDSDGSTYRLHNVEHSTFPAVARHEDDNPTFGQARKSELWPKWLQAILTEYTGLEQNGTWVFEKLPPGARPLNVKLVLKRKRGAEGEILKYKARLVVLGNEMKDVDMLSELFAPVGQQTTLKGMAATVAQFDLEWTQYDFSQAFVQSEIHGAPVYIKQGPGRPPELDENGHPYALRLVKSLYGLAFSPRLWHLKLHKWLTAYGWESSTSDPSLYRYKGMRMLLYVDDCCCIYDKKTSEKDYQKFMADLAKDFKYTGGDDVDFFLGFRITRDRKKHTVSMDQTAFIQKAVAHHGLTNAHPVDTPVVAGLQLGQVLCDPLDFTVDRTKYRERVGSLLWAARGTRPDIAFGVHMLSRAMHAPSPAHWDASTRMLAYLKTTETQGLTYQRCRGGDVLVGSVDADWLPKYGNDMCNMKSTTGFVFYLGGAAITWRSRRQSTFATSTAHSECNAAYEAGCEAVYLRKLMRDLGNPQTEPTLLHEDNQALIKISLNAKDQERTKHWDSKIFALREMITDFTIRFGYVSTKNQMADHLTKALPKPALERARGHCLGSRRIMFPVEFSKFTLEPPPSKSSPLFKAPVPGGGDRRT